jgi:thioredoxin-related protein
MSNAMRRNYFYLIPGVTLFFCISCAHWFSGKDRPPTPFKKNNITFVAQKKDFDALIKVTDGYTIVFFTEKYCTSCKTFRYAFKKAASAFSQYDNICFVTFDTFYDTSSARQYEVKGVPTTIILKDKKKIADIVGPVKKKELIQRIKTALNMMAS